MTWTVLLAGALLGLGATTLVWAWAPGVPDLTAALDRLDPTRATPAATTPLGPAWAHRATRHALPALATSLRLDRLAADLRVVDLTPEDLAARKIGYATLGAAFPTVLAITMGALGLALPVVIPAVATLVVAGVFFVLPEVEVRRRATEVRAAMRTAAGVYLELVALERAADAGTVEALTRAAAIGTSPEFARIRDALLRAELAGRPAWDGLTDLADHLGVPEYGDLADIMRLSGQDGAAVYATLRARAASLRTQLLTAATAKANTASEHLIIPTALLGVAFMALLGYPAISRILLG